MEIYRVQRIVIDSSVKDVVNLKGGKTGVGWQMSPPKYNLGFGIFDKRSHTRTMKNLDNLSVMRATIDRPANVSFTEINREGMTVRGMVLSPAEYIVGMNMCEELRLMVMGISLWREMYEGLTGLTSIRSPYSAGKSKAQSILQGAVIFPTQQDM